MGTPTVYPLCDNFVRCCRTVTHTEMEVEVSRPECADNLGADVQAVGIDTEMRGSACDVEPGPHC